jgi:tetratricopeptide (TPR) repeat protein
MKIKKLAAFLFLFACQSSYAQQTYGILLHEMRQFETDVVETYRNYLWLFYEEKQSERELLAFEDLLGTYVQRLRQAYETMALLGPQNLDEPRDIAARALIFRALTFLEKAPIDVTYFEKACYDYYEALTLYESTDKVPVIFKNLPYSIRLGNTFYHRLIDLLDEKGKDLFQFGQIYLILKNFKVTSPFDENALELVKLNEVDSMAYTYRLADKRLKAGFRRALQSNRMENVSLALPAGTYFIRSKKAARNDYTNLATVYVRPNQYISYLVEPIADWVIFYEMPGNFQANGSTPEADLTAIRDTTLLADSTMIANSDVNAAADRTNGIEKSPEEEGGANFHSVEKISRIIRNLLNNFPQDKVNELPITRTKNEFTRGLAQIISTRVSGEYLNSWNLWTQSWNIAKAVTEMFTANRAVSTPTIELVYGVIQNL